MRKRDTFCNKMKFCLTEQDDQQGSKAINYLKERLKHSNMQEITKSKSYSKQERIKVNWRQNKFYVVRSNTKQPSTFSKYRISSKQPNDHGSSSMNFNEIVQKAKLSLSEASLLDVPIVRVNKCFQQLLENTYNDYSKILMEKYYQSTIKYEEKQIKYAVKQFNNNISQNTQQLTKLTCQNQAVKNYKRKLKQSRRDQIVMLNKSSEEIRQNDNNLIKQCRSKSFEKYITIF